MHRNAPVKGEYTRVGEWSSDKIELQKAYFTPVSEAEAELLTHYYFPNADVVFYPDIRSTADNDHGGNLFLRLCNNPLTEEDIKEQINYPRLQLGMLLHELAHFRAGLYAGHSFKFVQALDDFILECKDGKFKELCKEQMEKENRKKKMQKSVAKILQIRCSTCGEPARIKSSIEDE